MKKILDIGFRKRSLLFAELSSSVYLDFKEIKKELADVNLGIHQYYNIEGSQAYSFFSDHDLIIACRGTELSSIKDIKAALYAWPEKDSNGARIHSGFLWHASKIWPDIYEDLAEAKRKNLTVWFTGHSMGGAISTILSNWCQQSSDLPNPCQLYTYGSPRVAWKKYIDNLSVNHVRWVNNNDIVTHVPPFWTGYKHHGIEFYMNSWGNVRKPSLWQRIKDRVRGAIHGWKNGKLDSFSDHSIEKYIENLETFEKGMETLQK